MKGPSFAGPEICLPFSIRLHLLVDTRTLDNHRLGRERHILLLVHD